MKFLTLTTTSLLAGSVSARSILSQISSSAVAPFDDSLQVPGANPLQHCADPKDDILTLKNVDLDPNPPLAGRNLSISATGQLTADVEDGAKVHLTVKYGLITIIRTTQDLCEQVKQVDLECPLKKDNEVKLTKEVTLPKEIPPGKYTVIADVLDKDENKITCLTASVNFNRGGSQQDTSVWKENL